MKRTFAGHNELAGMLNAVLWGIGTTFVLFAALMNGSFTLGFLWTLCLLLTPVIYFGARYRLTVSEQGVFLKSTVVWPLGRTQRFFLDCDADLYEAWESDRPEGVYLSTGSLLVDSDVFGPYYDTVGMGRLAEQINAAIHDARRLVTGSRDVNVSELEASDFEVLERAGGGVPRIVRNRRCVMVRDIDIPAGSRFLLHYDDWVDPARVDTIRTIELASPTAIHAHEVSAGGKLSFWDGEVTVTGLPLTFEYDGVHVAGADHPVTFRRGELTRFTAAAPLHRGEFDIPALSEFRQETLLAEPTWRVTFGGRLWVAGVAAEAGDSVTFDRKWRPKYVLLARREARVGNTMLEGNLQPLIVTKRGEVDLHNCKKRGLIAPDSFYVSRTEEFLTNLLFYGVGTVLYLGLNVVGSWVGYMLWTAVSG